MNRIAILILALAGLAGAAPMMRMSTASVALNVSAGSNPPVQVVELYNIGTGTLNPAALAGASWLQASIGAQTACSASPNGQCLPLSLNLTTSTLAAGTYTGFVSVADPNAVDSPQTIAVVVEVETVPSTLTLYAAPGGGIATATIDPKSPVSVQPSTSTGGSWLSVAAQGTSDGAYYPYLVTATTQTNQSAGTYTGSIVVSGSNYAPDNQTIGVTLNVTTSPIAQLSPSMVNLMTPTGTSTTGYVSVANAGQGSLAVSSALAMQTSAVPATQSTWLSAEAASNGVVAITANAASLQPGFYAGTVALNTNAANNASLTIPVNFLVTSQTGPLIGFGGVVDNAVASGTVAPGDIAVAYGIEFTSNAPASPTTTPLPTNFNNVQITVNGTPAPLYFTSAGQIDFEIPFGTPAGTAVVQAINNGQAGNSVSVTIADRTPKILLFGGGTPIIVNYADGSIPSETFTLLPSHAAHPGDTLIIYAIGLGQTDPEATTAVAATGSPLLEIDPPVTVTLGGGFSPTTTITPLFTGLAPGFVGLYQINVTLPENVPTGASGNSYAVPLMLTVQGAASNPVTIALAPAGQG
jgi:uncharacterized protein (TIGR03437 family)